LISSRSASARSSIADAVYASPVGIGRGEPGVQRGEAGKAFMIILSGTFTLDTSTIPSFAFTAASWTTAGRLHHRPNLDRHMKLIGYPFIVAGRTAMAPVRPAGSEGERHGSHRESVKGPRHRPGDRLLGVGGVVSAPPRWRPRIKEVDDDIWLVQLHGSA
jgi:hypothetical protein